MSLKAIELFAGLGSQTQALKNIGVEHEVAAISEIDKYAHKSYEALHGAVNNLGDITKIERLPQADLWTYSFPCTDISVAGKQAGLGVGTRSGLLWEVERLLLIAKQDGLLPKYLLLENVKNLIGKKFKADFDKWLAFLISLGYQNVYKVLNSRDYGIPQNRERVFCVSVLNGGAEYKFPDKFPLRLRLKDMLDGCVDEKFYLTERALRGIRNSNFNQTAARIQDGDYCDTLCSRDYKDPKCVEVGTLFGGKWDKHYKMGRRVYDPDGLSPVVHTCCGGNTHLKVISGQFRPKDRDYNRHGTERDEQFETRKDDVSNAILTGEMKNCVQIVALRGRNPDNPSDRTAGAPTVQRLEPSYKGLCNTLTSVQKDNLVLEASVLTSKRTEYGKAIRKAYESDEVAESRRNMTALELRSDGASNIVTTVTKENYLAERLAALPKLKREGITDSNAETSKTVRVGGHGMHKGHTWDVIADNVRIRKLTPRECLRLMGWRDCQIDKIRAAGLSNAQMYKQAGNGIVVMVLMAIFGELFNAPYRERIEEWDYRKDTEDGGLGLKKVMEHAGISYSPADKKV